MKPFEKCPVCGGETTTKQMEKLLKGGGNMLALQITADACQRCGEHLYSQDMVLFFEEIRHKLRTQEFTHFKNIGQSFTVEDGWPDKAINPVL